MSCSMRPSKTSWPARPTMLTGGHPRSRPRSWRERLIPRPSRPGSAPDPLAADPRLINHPVLVSGVSSSIAVITRLRWRSMAQERKKRDAEVQAEIALRECVDWARAVELQRDRILKEEHDAVTQVVDAKQLAHAVAQVETAARLARKQLRGDAYGLLHRAVTDFETEVPDFRDLRDVIEHFDEYEAGTGQRQRPASADH